MSLAEKEAWKNSTPNCFTRCAGTVIMNPSDCLAMRWRWGAVTTESIRSVKYLSIRTFLVWCAKDTARDGAAGRDNPQHVGNRWTRGPALGGGRPPRREGFAPPAVDTRRQKRASALAIAASPKAKNSAAAT